MRRSWLRPAFARSDAPTVCAPPPASTLTVNVKDEGAKGDGQTDDTAVIQAAIDAIGGTKGTVLVPEGVYMIDAVDNRLHLKDDMTLKLADGAVLKAIPNDSKKYSLLTISGVSNIWVIGGTLEGERDQHKGKSGEWGSRPAHRQGRQAHHRQQRDLEEDVGRRLLRAGRRGRALLRRHRRCQPPPGICRSSRPTGFWCELGVQEHARHAAVRRDRFAPDRVEQKITNVRIVGSKFIDNAGPGILVAGKKARVTKIEMTRNTFRNNPVVVEYAPSLAAAICGNRRDKHRDRAHRPVSMPMPSPSRWSHCRTTVAAAALTLTVRVEAGGGAQAVGASERAKAGEARIAAPSARLTARFSAERNTAPTIAIKTSIIGDNAKIWRRSKGRSQVRAPCGSGWESTHRCRMCCNGYKLLLCYRGLL